MTTTPAEEMTAAARRESAVVVPDLAAPDWAAAGRVHDWRNYVPEEVQAAWPRLGEDARVAVFLTAEQQAGREEWD